MRQCCQRAKRIISCNEKPGNPRLLRECIESNELRENYKDQNYHIKIQKNYIQVTNIVEDYHRSWLPYIKYKKGRTIYEENRFLADLDGNSKQLCGTTSKSHELEKYMRKNKFFLTYLLEKLPTGILDFINFHVRLFPHTIFKNSYVKYHHYKYTKTSFSYHQEN